MERLGRKDVMENKTKANEVLHVSPNSTRHPMECVHVWLRFVVQHEDVLSGWKIVGLAIPPTDRVIYGVEEVWVDPRRIKGSH